jgi:hypothetical protein
MGETLKKPTMMDTPGELLDSSGKGTQSYSSNPKKATDRELPTTPFPATLKGQRNALMSAYHTHSQIRWKNFMKGRIAEQWIKFIETHYANQGYRLNARDWATKFISALRENMQRGWTFRNDIYHADINGRIVIYTHEEEQQRTHSSLFGARCCG